MMSVLNNFLAEEVHKACEHISDMATYAAFSFTTNHSIQAIQKQVAVTNRSCISHSAVPIHLSLVHWSCDGIM